MRDAVVDFERTPCEPYRSSRFGLIAWHLAEHGLRCFPLRIDEDGAKLPLVKWRVYQVARPTRDEINRWVRRFPNAGAAIPTGADTGLIVVDADSPDAIESLETRGMPETVMVRTRRGLHHYLTYPVGVRVGNSAGVIGPGVDIRGSGGMVVAAGTRRPDGFIYHYAEGHALGEVPIAPCPDWLMRWLVDQDSKRLVVSEPVVPHPFNGRISAWARTAIDRELGRLASAANGSRNTTLSAVSFKLGQLAGGGEADGVDLRLAVGAIASRWTDETSKSLDTIARAFAEGEAHPRCRRVRDAVEETG